VKHAHNLHTIHESLLYKGVPLPVPGTIGSAARISEVCRELRRANKILKLASAFFSQAELERRLKS
jgi:transposase-like protein